MSAGPVLSPSQVAVVLIDFELWWRRHRPPVVIDTNELRSWMLGHVARFGMGVFDVIRAEVERIVPDVPATHTVQCPTCPGCDTPPGLLLSLTQAVCEGDRCRVMMWNTTVTAAEQLAEAAYIDPTRLTGPPPADGGSSGQSPPPPTGE